MKKRILSINSWPSRSLLILIIAACSTHCHAVGVTDWRTYKASPATTLSGQGTDDPIVGSLTTTANSSFVIGYLSTAAVLGTNTGDAVKLTFGVAFNDAGGMSNNGDNFRFALFDLNGEAQDSATGGDSGTPNYATAGTDNTDDFRGYWLGVKNGTGTGSGGSIRERIAALASGDNAFAATGTNNVTAPSLGSVGGDPVTLVSDVNGDGAGADYTGVLTLTRNATGLIDVTGSFIGSNAATGNVFSASDTSAATLPSTFGAVGFLIGNALSADEVIFTNIDVAVIPAAAALLGDFNSDGKVDAGDYVTWRANGATNPLANDNGLGTPIGAAHYNLWRGNFGNPPGSGSGNNLSGGAVPEPQSVLLLIVAAIIASCFARRRATLALQPARVQPSR